MATEINIKIPTNPMTMLAQGDNEFTIMASVIARAGGTFANGNPIIWNILNNTDGHGSSFFRYVGGDSATSQLEIRYPTVKNVLSFVITGDEAISARNITMGASVSFNSLLVRGAFILAGNLTVRGNGTNQYTITSPNNTGATFGNISAISGYSTLTLTSLWSLVEGTSIVATYQGPNQYTIQRAWSGLGSGVMAFRMIDTNGNPVTTPSSDDYVIISNVGVKSIPTNFNTYTTGTITNNNILLNNNIWNIGLFELWMKAAPISTTEIKVKWQSKSGVTQYKLLRSTAFTVDANGDYVLTTPTEIYSGTDLSFVDTDLTPNTMYYYQLLDQTDTEITQFNTKTL